MAIDVRCPQCGSDAAVRKVSAIYQEGVQSSSMAGHTANSGFGGSSAGGFAYSGGGSTALRGSSMSLLAQRFQPPVVPKELPVSIYEEKWVDELARSLRWPLAIGSAVAWATACFVLKVDWDSTPLGSVLPEGRFESSAMTFMVMAIVAMYPSAVLTWTRDSTELRKQHVLATEQAHEALERWEQLWYCGRCDIEFERRENDVI